MKIFAISDLHLGNSVDKPMDIFGAAWDNHWQLICEDWLQKVSDEDVVLIGGDISWAMSLSDAVPDLQAIAALPGEKIIIKGNHDLWWSSLSKVEAVLPPTIKVLQHTALRRGSCVITGTRGWQTVSDKTDEADKKIYNRELIRAGMAIEAAKKIAQEGDTLIMMLHYPPFDVNLSVDTPMLSLIEQSGISKVIYGHLHGNNCRVVPLLRRNGVEYHLTSCDLVGHKLLRLI